MSLLLAVLIGVAVGRSEGVARGLVCGAIVLGYGVTVTLLGHRNEAAALLSGTESDERRAAIMLKAQAVTCQVLVLAVVIGAIVQVARGQESGAFLWLSALAGATFILASAVLSRRS